MSHVFVWTVSDIVGLALTALVLTFAAFIGAWSLFDSWSRKRRARGNTNG